MFKTILLCLYSFILKLVAVAWASTTKIDLAILLRRQTHAARIIYFKYK